MTLKEIMSKIDFDDLGTKIPGNEAFYHLVGLTTGALNNIYYFEQIGEQTIIKQDKQKEIKQLFKLYLYKIKDDTQAIQEASKLYESCWGIDIATGVNNIITSARTMQSINWFVYLAKYEEVGRDEFERLVTNDKG